MKIDLYKVLYAFLGLVMAWIVLFLIFRSRSPKHVRSCIKNVECGDGYQCINEGCIGKKCMSYMDCPSDMDCMSGNCLRVFRHCKDDPSICPDYMNCVDGLCAYKNTCKKESDCSAENDCVDGRCSPKLKT